jgi:hypothetical protein
MAADLILIDSKIKRTDASSEFRSKLMDLIVERVLASRPIQASLNGLLYPQLRSKVGIYIATLCSAGQNDVNQLIEFALAYVRAHQQGPDSRYTGC